MIIAKKELENETKYFVRMSRYREILLSPNEVPAAKEWYDKKEINMSEALSLDITDDWLQFKQDSPSEWNDQNQLMLQKWEEWDKKQKADKMSNEKANESKGSRALYVWLSHIFPCLFPTIP